MTHTAVQTVERHMAAIRSRDLDAIVATYAPDAVLVDTDRIGRGVDHIRAAHAEVLDAAADLEPELELLADGDVVFVAWKATSDDDTDAGTELVGTNTFVVADGLITVNTGFITNAATPGRLVGGRH